MQALLVAFLLAADREDPPADPPAEFVRGDVDGDLRVSFRDAIRLIDFQFAEGPVPPCLDAADFDDDGAITIGDAIGLLLYLFAGGSAPLPPGTRCGADPTPDLLTCEFVQDCRAAILVRGQRIDGTAFFFCLDRSSSMSWTWDGRTKFDIARRWVCDAIQALNDEMEFGVIAFDGQMLIFSEDPITATVEASERAIAWVTGLETGISSCLAPAGVKTIEMANRSSSEKSRVLIVTDGSPTCNGEDTEDKCLDDITAANVRKIPIDTAFVPHFDWPFQDSAFLRELAARNGGEFRKIGP